MFARAVLTIAIAATMLATVPLNASAGSDDPPPGPGLDLIQRSCINCHDVFMITAKRKTPREWADVVGLMADRGAEVTPEEIEIIEKYLADNYSSVASGSSAAR